jgi:glycosyltransferase involved in cell wall biosynthesis
MRILWHGVSPLANTGYGILTNYMIHRLRDMGHFVRVATRHADRLWQIWDGFEMVEGVNRDHVNQMIEEEHFDFIFTLWDIWQMANLSPRSDGHAIFPADKWVAYIPVDAQLIPAKLATIAVKTTVQIAMSLHGKSELEKIGLKPLYGPCGIETSIYHPKPERRKVLRDAWGLTDDNFLIGSVGFNYSDDRKGFFPLMQAFRIFHERHPEARLYIHTHWPGIIPNMVNYAQIAEAIGVHDYILVPDQQKYDTGRIDRDQLADIYNAMDVFCLATKGEGFGIPVVEAQACGTPAIMTDNTTGPQLCASGWLIHVEAPDDLFWMLNQGWRYEPRPSEILKQLEIAYTAWKSNLWRDMKAGAISLGLDYNWKMIWEHYWVPIVKQLGERFGK